MQAGAEAGARTQVVLVNLSGRGDKDVHERAEELRRLRPLRSEWRR